MELQCGPLTFTSNFDSGNLGRAELVLPPLGWTPGTSWTSYTHDYEVNLWTKPDCFGTRFANGNRTWFYFGVAGGKPNGVLKLNILNLNKQSRIFEQGMQPVWCCIPEKPKWERVKDRCAVLDQGVNEKSCGITFRQKLPADTRNSTMFIAFTYPFSYTNLCEWLADIDLLLHWPSPTTDNKLVITSDIYYHRECVCFTLQGRRVELITISSLDGISSDREEYINNMFPSRAERRPYKFPNKKIVFLSSRVHPGEVPSQFVMNGILKFLLEERDPRALMLRRLFVFKLIPMLNPDGVHNGNYRTDSRGVNLNRVYLQPSPTLHPSVYAARKLILYAHYGHDTPDDYEYPTEEETNNSEMETASQNAEKKGEAEITESTESRLCAGCIELPLRSQNICGSELEHVARGDDSDLGNEDALASLSSKRGQSNAHQCTFESCDEDSIIENQEGQRNRSTESHVTDNENQTSLASVIGALNPKIEAQSAKPCKPRISFSSKKGIELELSALKATSKGTGFMRTSMVKSTEVESGLFLYVDFHGHATKRGIFMYGNHFTDVTVQTECLLLPKLMAFNCQHFDFSACNFTQRLMTMKDRSDGASREGSGRVAVSKLTGLIRSYTLECNYNTGRLVNHLILRPESYGLNDPPPNSIHHPPKFTPELFEATGRSLGESILDLTGINPYSRLKSTEHHNLDGLRSFLHRRLSHSIDYKPPLSTVRPSPISLLPTATGNRANVPPIGKIAPKATVRLHPKSPVLIKRSVSAKISSSNSSTSATAPLVTIRVSKGNLTSKAPLPANKASMDTLLEKPTTSAKGKLKVKVSQSVPAVSQSDSGFVLSSAASTDNRFSKAFKLNKKKKNTIKSKAKKLKTFKRSESR